MANRTLLSTGGNYNATGTWAEGIVPTIADAVLLPLSGGQLTINVVSSAQSIDCSAYANTLTMNATLTVNGNVTLGSGMTIAGASSMNITANSTLTSNGKTWPNNWTWSNNGLIYTFADNWTFTGNSGQSSA